jgi:cation diffusion facilitator family transporter
LQKLPESVYKLKVLKRSTIAISTVVLVEVILGLAVGSLAIVSDGLHATLDAVTTLALFIATRASLKPPDEEHMYGHEKFESLGGLVGGIALIGIALVIMYEAVSKIIRNLTITPGLEYAGFIAIGFTFCIDFFRVGTLLKARKSSQYRRQY